MGTPCDVSHPGCRQLQKHDLSSAPLATINRETATVQKMVLSKPSSDHIGHCNTCIAL